MINKQNEDINNENNQHQNEKASSFKMEVYEQKCISNNNKFSKHANILLNAENYINKLRNKANNFYFIYVIVTIIHLLIYANRGILSGSYDYLSSYFKYIYPQGNVDVHIGILVSVFIYGISINSIISGSLAYKNDPFKITTLFLFQYALALILTSIFFVIKSYYGLIFSRFFCGFSEAAFVTIIPSLIFSYSKHRAGAWISIFYMMCPLGTCLSYLLAPILSMLKITIPHVFVSSSICLIALSFIFCLFDEKILKKNDYEKNKNNTNILKDKDINLEHDDSSINGNLEKCNEQKITTENNLNITTTKNYNSDNKYLEIELDNCIEALEGEKTESDLYSLLYNNFSNISFLLVVLGLTAHIDIMSCHLVYGPTILYSYGIYPSYKLSVIICSIAACLSSIIGTIFGGYLVDYNNLNIHDIDKHYEHIKNSENINKLYKKDFLVYKFIKLMSFSLLIVSVFGSICMMIAPFTKNIYIFTALLFLGYTALFALSPGQNILVMAAFPKNLRPFSVGLSSFLSHILGDIPWVIIIGKIKGTLAPDCVVTINSEVTDTCRSQSTGLLITLMIISSKTIVIILGTFLLYIYAKKKMIKYKNIRFVS
ncbi:organic anion transporter, putative [Plasmodium berghei]|uniref:Major facilitator superfamily-related transporter, putative n=2 Tax=Plasmodium berghei TaxID=5821 RepID=A0A509AD80_PLABA|nr:major facilitator superfamily-related transporter, putative [Plasmodium berghei ANKA]CXH83781.1 organic anion transporter, putative [Plasmodium berghei]SCM19285.1 organic anion transporter, putative [Plasmodium berghei]SCN21732.1 organic anion transporter, putative [Plasmodium berghei]SCO58947.1 organic anion transporter, putative [Plasmodium berghei]SCO58992.1 organic anion transporter, putative [Plasmodium berghei]|eukprot:XP_034419726.1 major facilitator superfamily-related transporter, putative [Plasmodium berghei ANKA]